MFWRRYSGDAETEDVLKPVLVEDECNCNAEKETIDIQEESIAEKQFENTSPFRFFGMEEEKTEKWLTKCVKFWYCIMSLLWFFFGAVTFAPIIFVSNKVNVVFKSRKFSLLFSILLYIALVVCLILF
jgi:hypothetical protein